MEIPPSPFWPLSLASTLAMGALSVYVWTRRSVPGAHILVAALLAITELCATAALQERASTLAGQVFWLHVQIVGYAAAPVLWFLVTRIHVERPLPRKHAAALFLVPLAGVLVHWTDSWHHLYWSRTWIDRTGAVPVMGRTYGAAFWVFVGYSWVMMAAAAFTLLRSFPKDPIQRGRRLALFGAMLLPLGAAMLYVFDWSPVRYIDITPYAFVATGALIVWALFRYRLQGIVPVAARSVVESMGDGVIVLDIDGRVAQLNPAVENLLGCSKEQLLGRRASDALLSYPELIEYCEKSGELAGDVSLESGDGHRVCAASGRDVTRKNRRIGRVITLHDVTAERQASEQLREARVAAEAAAIAKSRFLANMSHEIRTPMNGVVGAAELLLDSDLNEEQMELVRTTQESAHCLLSILNDILDFSKIDAGKLELDQIPFDLRRAMDQIVRLMWPLAVKKGLDLRFRMAPEAPRVIVGDPTRLRQVFLNLIGNALKFTSAGWVAIGIDLLSTDPDQVRLAMTVEDTGVGIAAERIGALFQEFTQADSSVTRNFGGTGLGLAISQRLVNKMGGTIRVESTLGQGSKFTVELPVRPGEVHEVANSPATLAGIDPFPGCRVLLVEDNLVNQKIGLKLLEKLGCRVEVGNNGREAIRLAGAAEYDIILMDLHMPVLDGFEAAREIRRLGIGTPIVALTASVLDETRKACKEAGMDSFITKPIRLEEIASVLKTWHKLA